jgi:hypothetical protein
MASLQIVSGNGSQSDTQSPQNLVNTTNNTEAGTSVQPGTSTSLLTTASGIQLKPIQLPTVSLTSSLTSKVATTPPTPPKHQLNSALLGLSIALFVLAIVLFWSTARTGKNTTKYD